MPTQIEKLEAHAAHLLDGFIQLREKYAILDPMLFKPEVNEQYGAKKQARGFEILRHSLFLSCSQDIAKFCLDTDKRTPSIVSIVNALGDEKLRDQLRERYAVWKLPSIKDEKDPAIIEALKRIEEREEKERRNQFDENYARLVKSWGELSDTQAMKGYSSIRDKVSAHTEIKYVADKYQLIDIGSLEIKWGDMRSTIESMQELIELIGFIVRNAGFAWNMLEEQLNEAAQNYWNVTEEP